MTKTTDDHFDRSKQSQRFMEIYRELTPWWQRLLYKLLPPFCFGPFCPGIKHSLKILWRNLVGHPREFLVTGVAPPEHKNAAAAENKPWKQYIPGLTLTEAESE